MKHKRFRHNILLFRCKKIDTNNRRRNQRTRQTRRSWFFWIFFLREVFFKEDLEELTEVEWRKKQKIKRNAYFNDAIWNNVLKISFLFNPLWVLLTMLSFLIHALQISTFFLSEIYLIIPRASIKGAGAPSFQCHSRSSCLANTATEGSTVLIYIIIVSSFHARCIGDVRSATHRIWLSGWLYCKQWAFTSGIKLKSDRFSTGINLKSDSFYNKDKTERW